MNTQGYLSVPEMGSNDAEYVRKIAQALNRAIAGKINAVRQVTLAAGAGSTIISDDRISVNSFISLQPVTLNAGQMVYWYTSAQSNGTVTINHPNDAFADKTFNILIIG